MSPYRHTTIVELKRAIFFNEKLISHTTRQVHQRRDNSIRGLFRDSPETGLQTITWGHYFESTVYRDYGIRLWHSMCMKEKRTIHMVLSTFCLLTITIVPGNGKPIRRNNRRCSWNLIYFSRCISFSRMSLASVYRRVQTSFYSLLIDKCDIKRRHNDCPVPFLVNGKTSVNTTVECVKLLLFILFRLVSLFALLSLFGYCFSIFEMSVVV